jgi:hypothetical protein
MTALPATTTALDAARHNLRWALRNGKPWDQIRHLRANVAREEGTRFYVDRLQERDHHYFVFDLLATGGPGRAAGMGAYATKTYAQIEADRKNAEGGR